MALKHKMIRERLANMKHFSILNYAKEEGNAKTKLKCLEMGPEVVVGGSYVE